MGCFEITLDRIHYQWGYDKMLIKSLKESVKTIVARRTLQPETIKEMANWLHNLEFLIVKVLMFTIGIHHLYVYTIKTVF